MILPDVNILLYAYHSGAEQHKESKEWLLSELSSNRICFGWQTITGFLRISTSAKGYTDPLDAGTAFEIVESWLIRPGSTILTPTDRHFDIFKNLVKESDLTGPKMMDGHLAALAIEHGATLASNDRDFRRFDGLKLINPLVKSKQ